MVMSDERGAAILEAIASFAARHCHQDIRAVCRTLKVRIWCKVDQ